jgi:hypothetical protein
MRRPVSLVLLSATALLAACGQKPADKGVDASTGSQSLDEVKAQARKVQLKPGQWEGSFTLESLDMKGMPQGTPPGMAEQMKSAMARTMRYCVTPEQAANPDGKVFSGQENKDCAYSGFDASGGSVKGQVICKTNGATMTMVMAGSYAPERFDMHMDMQQAGLPNGMSMAMKAKTSGKWIGPTCSK